MTSRLIEKCFDVEEYELTCRKYPIWIIDPSLVNLDDLKQALSVPGNLIRIKSMDAVHTINYGEINYDY